MRGLAGLSDSIFNPSSVGFADTFSRKGRRTGDPVDNFRRHPAAIGKAVVNLICSMAKLDDTSVSGAVAIRRR